jgi:hypothetical protein
LKKFLLSNKIIFIKILLIILLEKIMKNSKEQPKKRGRPRKNRKQPKIILDTIESLETESFPVTELAIFQGVSSFI